MHSRLLPYALALASGGIWGLTFSLARMATEASKEPLGLALWQAVGGALVLFIYCILRKQMPPISKRSIRHFAVIGVFGSAIPSSLLFYAAPNVPAGVLAITIALVPIITYALSLLIGSDHYSLRRLIGIGAGFVAILLIMLPDSDVQNNALTEGSTRFWVAMSLLATVAYTMENIYVDRSVARDVSMAGILLGGLTAAALVLAPIVWITDAFVPLSLPFDNLDAVVVAMSIVSSLAYLMFLSLIRLAGAVFASMSGYVVTLSGVFWGIVIFSETHSIWIWGALIMMIVGMALVTPNIRSGSPVPGDQLSNNGQ